MKKISMARVAVAAALFAGLLSGPAHALPITKANLQAGVFDASSGSRSVTILAGDLGGSAANNVLNVSASIDFMKCGDDGTPGTALTANPGLPTACPDTVNPAFANEIVLRLRSPDAQSVVLVDFDTYFPTPGDGPTPGSRITINFTDGAINDVGGQTFAGGNFRPVGFLSDFINHGAIGDWILEIEDLAGGAPLGIAGFELSVTVSDVTNGLPLPGTLLLLVAGLLGLAVTRRR